MNSAERLEKIEAYGLLSMAPNCTGLETEISTEMRPINDKPT